MTEIIEEFNNLKINDEQNEHNEQNEQNEQKNKNKGTGAGGKNTNKNGKSFENITDIENKLIENKYEKKVLDKSKYGYYLILLKNINNNKIIYLSQNGLKLYVKKTFNIELFRCPDEAYIIEYNSGKKIIKILEKKAQNGDGSVETKLWASPSLKREYELMLDELNKFEVHYNLCVNIFLKKKLISNEKKYKILNKILNENNINILFGDDEDYFDIINDWINNSL